MSTPRRKVALVVGGGVAGATCAAELAALTCGRVDVVLLSATPVVRVATPGALRRSLDISAAPAEDWAAGAGVIVEIGAATGMCARSVTLFDGRTLPFDVCCVATGARPRVPSVFGGKELQGSVLTVRDTDDVGFLKRAIGKARRVLLVGNGGIAMELAHELRGRECDVVWVIRGEHVGNAFFDQRGGDALFQFLGRGADVSGGFWAWEEGEGCEHRSSMQGSGVGPDWLGRREQPVIYTSRSGEVEMTEKMPAISKSALRIERCCDVLRVQLGRKGSGWPVAAELSNGTTITCDVVVCATGVIPNVEWLGSLSRVPLDNGSGSSVGSVDSDCRGGVLVHAGSMRSVGRRDVFAAGDCTTVVRGSEMGADSGNNWFQMRLWTQAAAAARAAAAGMAAVLTDGLDGCAGIEFDLFAHATRFFGQRVIMLGRYNAQGLEKGYRVIEGGGDNRFVRVVVDNGRVRGALLIGDTELAETFENLILDRLDVSHIAEAELVDPTVDLEDYFD